mmetsp:Transcript_28249/g.27203  ORF Transcript_28249/g.27203 Transcript_28249/m.27203 type:complete len:160 (+) Transcript_28249:984-1463(+)
MEAFHRKSLTKHDRKEARKLEREHLQERLEHLDDLKDIVQVTQGLSQKKEEHADTLKVPKEFLKKVRMGDLKVKSGGDQVYQGQVERNRDKKARRKADENLAKGQKELQAKQMEEEIQRNVSYDMIKNKGLTRKRKKIERNPRKKLREKYSKALVKRRS